MIKLGIRRRWIHITASLVLAFSFLVGAQSPSRAFAHIPYPASTFGRSVHSVPSSTHGPVATHRKIQLERAFGRLPLAFEVNRGQAAKGTQFFAHGRGYSLSFTLGGPILTLTRAGKHTPHGRVVVGRSRGSHVAAHAQRPTTLRLRFVGGNAHPRMVGIQKLPGIANYYIGNNSKRWVTGVATYSHVMYRNVYPGIDVDFYGRQGQLEYDWVIRPGANPNLIRLRIDGARHSRLDRQGNTILQVPGGEVRQTRPIIYQPLRGATKSISGGYTMRGAGSFQVKLGRYDRSKTLVVDPTLQYSTFGGTNYENLGNGIAVDSTGSAWIVGTERSNAPGNVPLASLYNCDPLTPGASYIYDNIYAVKLNPTGTAVTTSVSIGGNGCDEANGVALDASGNVHIVGNTSSSGFPGTANAYQKAINTNTQCTYNQSAVGPSFGPYSCPDAIVTTLSNTGGLLYSTYLGGTAHDHGQAIAVDSAGNNYVVGFTGNGDFPGFTALCSGDAFVAVLNATLSALAYRTCIGGSGTDAAYGVAVDGAGNAYVTGQTQGGWTATNNAPQMLYHGGNDAFVAKLDPSGTVTSSTYLGGSGSDSGQGIALDTAGNVYVAGTTYSTDFPTASQSTGAYQTSLKGQSDAFVTELDSNLNYFLSSTYLGGTGPDSGSGVMLDGSGNVYVTGTTGSTDFPVVSASQPTSGGSDDAFLTRFVNGSPDFSTYLGGSANEQGAGIAVDSNGNAYLAGSTQSTNFPTTGGAAHATSATLGTGAPWDIFAAKFSGPITLTACNETALRNAIATAPSGATIAFACSGTIPLTSSAGGTISINKSLTLDGSGQNVTIDGGKAVQLFSVPPGNAFSIKNLALTNGNAANSGGAIVSTGTLNVSNSTFSGNNAAGNGGAISTSGGLTVTNSTFTGNTAGHHGGAIDANDPSGAPASSFAGDTFASNTAQYGGAVSFGTNNPASVVNSTFTGNTASADAAALYTYAPLALSFNTVANNSVTGPGGGGTLGFNTIGPAGVTLVGNILANNINCDAAGTRGDLGSNLTFSGDHCGLTGSTNKFDVDPQLGALANNGGPTQTLALGPTSPAIDGAASCNGTGSIPIVTDQRGVSRPQGAACDIGAYEITAQVPKFSSGQDGAFTWAGTSANPLSITGTAVANSTVTLYSNGSCNGSSIASTTADSSGNWAVPVSNISTEGLSTYSATSTTGTNFVSGCSNSITVHIDRTAPSSAVAFPALGSNAPYESASAWTNGCNVGPWNATNSICGTASDNTGGSGVAAVYVAIEASDGTFWNGTSFTSSGAWLKANGTTSWSIAVPRPVDGVYTVASAAFDNAGNTQQVFQKSVAGICAPTQAGGQLSLNGGQLSLNGGLCTVNGMSGNTPFSGQLSLNGGQLSLNGGQLSLNGGQLSLNGGQLSLNGGTCTLRDNSGNSATYTVSPGATLTSNGGQLSLNGGQLSLNGGQLSLNGGLLTGSGGQLSLNGGQLSLNGGNCNVTDSNGNTGQLSLNGGQLSLNGGSPTGGQLSLNGGQLSINGGQLSLNGGQLSLNGGQLSLNGGAGGNAGNVVVDTVAPVATSFLIDNQTGDGAGNINPDATFHIHFDESMSAGTVNGATISVSPSPTTAPACEETATCLNASFKGLQPNTYYTVTVGGVTDLAGNPISDHLTQVISGVTMSTPYPTTFHFTTAAGPPVTGTSAHDDDSDGIPNGWDGTTTPTFTLGAQTTNTLAWGFSPSHKDLCLVENYMVGPVGATFYDQHISQAANQAVVNAFANSPVPNPDGTHGVHVVIFEGPSYSAGLPSGYAGPYFGGPIGMVDPLGDASSGSLNWAARATGTTQSFESISREKFLPTGLSQFCHYAVIAHTLGNTGSSGASRGINASQLVVALGGTRVGAGIGTQSEQQGTLMHELGHNLGLHHGGGPDISDGDINYKPNYMSVMNYLYQFEGVPGGFTTNGLDYSHGTITTPLDESNLSDSMGLGSGALLPGGAVFGTRYFCSGGSLPNIVADATRPINWACSTSGPAPTGTTTQADVNADGSPSSAPWEVLHDYNDWANLNFREGDIGFGSVPPAPATTTIDISNGASDPYGGGANSAPAIESKAIAKYSFTGFFPPLNPNNQGTVMNTGKGGRTYPVKFQLKDTSGEYVSTLSAIRSITYSTSTVCAGGTTNGVDNPAKWTEGLRYDSSSNQFQFNWKTPGPGCFMLRVSMSDGANYLSLFSLS